MSMTMSHYVSKWNIFKFYTHKISIFVVPLSYMFLYKQMSYEIIVIKLSDIDEWVKALNFLIGIDELLRYITLIIIDK